MPIYEYECERCATRFELKRPFEDDGDSARCPRCKGKARRLFFPCAIVFKGSGFYVTDSRGNHGHQTDESKPDKVESKKTESS